MKYLLLMFYGHELSPDPWFIDSAGIPTTSKHSAWAIFIKYSVYGVSLCSTESVAGFGYALVNVTPVKLNLG